MQDDVVFVLLDLSRDLEQLENDCIGLCGRKFGMLERLGAQLLMQHVGGTMQDKPHAVGEKGGAGCSVRSQAVQIGVNGVRVGQIYRGHHEARIVAQRHPLRLEDDPERHVP